MLSYRMLKTEVTRYMQQLMVLATSNVVVCKPQASCHSSTIFSFQMKWAPTNRLLTFFEKISDQVNDFHPDSALMIGDSLTADIQGGNNAGIDSIWFNPKGLVNETPAIPTYQVKNYQEILTILSK